MNLKRYNDLVEERDRLRRDVGRAEGALEQSEARLRKEFKLKSLDDAMTELTCLARERVKKEKEFEKKLAEYEEEWDDSD